MPETVKGLKNVDALFSTFVFFTLDTFQLWIQLEVAAILQTPRSRLQCGGAGGSWLGVVAGPQTKETPKHLELSLDMRLLIVALG